jgi:hypothetical protein
MKDSINKITIIAVTIVVGLVATASTSFACGGNWMGHGTNAAATLTVEQQQKLDVVNEKYSPQLDELQSSLNSKADEYSRALTNDNTTVGTLNRLETERVDLERQYRALLDQANNETGLYVSGNNGPWFGCNYNGCNHQDHMGHMGPGHRNERCGRHTTRNG